ncbi:DinB family protein [Candidatus Palauibacter sp.]|uniref:DinB family protein n=1 Tax=Candidatus Palauibacter sp. TaxID=3101350 RepID=UPI003B5AB2EF
MKRKFIAALVIAWALTPASLFTQAGFAPNPTGAPVAAPVAPVTDPTTIRDEFLGHFRSSSRKISELARVMPAEKFSWAPGEGVMQVGEVYMHLARYNFMYLDENLGIAPPNGFDYADIESLRDKDRVREIFEMSVRHVNEQVGALTGARLDEETELYGRTVQGWAVLLQLISHMNEHVGQSVAYARMNGVVPPWSR